MYVPPLSVLSSLIVTAFASLLGLAVTIGVGYLLVLLGGALLALRENAGGASRRVPPEAGQDPQRIVVVIPAHDEELVLAATLESLSGQTYPSERYEVVVVADNCTDATARIAREHDAVVLERFDTTRRGKGYALEWAFSQLLVPGCGLVLSGESADAFVIVDADTWVAPDFLAVMGASVGNARRTGGPGVALQGYYGVLNPRGGWRAALMSAAFDLFNHIKPLGADRLGLSVGLKGNGMAFDRAALERAPWQGHSITEDIDYGLDLLQKHGIRARYVPRARVLAQMPVTATQAASQRERWERGRYRLLRERAPVLFREGLRQRKLRWVVAALDLAMPPLAELTALLVVWALVVAGGVYGGLLRPPALWLGAWAVTALGLVSYVLVGLRAANATRDAYLALLLAPVYILWKFVLLGVRFFSRRLRRRDDRVTADAASGEEWVRTERIGLPTSGSPSSPGPVSTSSAGPRAGHEGQAP